MFPLEFPFSILVPVLIGVVVLIVLILIVRAHRRRREYRYYRFVDENSRALEEQFAVNRKYVFPDAKPILITHDYDNKDTFQNVSCRDYLIYKLEYDPTFRDRFLSPTRSIADPDQMIADYRKELAAIDSFGQFKVKPKRLKRKRLLEIERQRFESRTKRPPSAAVCAVQLSLSTLSGRVTDKKEETFPYGAVTQLISRLRDKNGDYYNDREIWDALCRVERSRVTNKLRFEIFQRDGYRCRNCGKTDAQANLEIDHIYPVSKGGKSIPDNLQTLCRDCNLAKGNRV